MKPKSVKVISLRKEIRITAPLKNVKIEEWLILIPRQGAGIRMISRSLRITQPPMEGPKVEKEKAIALEQEATGPDLPFDQALEPPRMVTTVPKGRHQAPPCHMIQSSVTSVMRRVTSSRIVQSTSYF